MPPRVAHNDCVLNGWKQNGWRRYTKEDRLAMQDSVERGFAKLRRWSWAVAIPLAVFGLALVSPLIPPPITVAKVAPFVLLVYLFTWGVLWITGKTGGKYFETWNLPDGR